VKPEKPFYFENLDGFRGIAAFFVVFAHMSYWFQYPNTAAFKAYKYILSFGEAGGRLGVIFFFVLSGFLITYLMFIEQKNTDKIGMKNFYTRRVLRIWPLYFFTLFIGFCVYPFLVASHGGDPHENASPLLYSLFSANFDHIYNGFPTCHMLGVQWSVSVEEQFYLIWPLIVIIFSKHKFFPYILCVLILISESFSFLMTNRLNAVDYHFLTCLRYLTFGALLSYFCFNKEEKVIEFVSSISIKMNKLIYVVCLVVLFLQNTITGFFPNYIYMYHIVPVLFFGYIIVEQNFSRTSFYKIKNFPTLTWLGKISYGLYLTHMIAISIVIGLFTNGEEYVLLKDILTIGIAILISALSFYTLEKYFLSLKTKLSKTV
jgi:peptidoglycan/LPS O-acetylase OafA/YrhL